MVVHARIGGGDVPGAVTPVRVEKFSVEDDRQLFRLMRVLGNRGAGLHAEQAHCLTFTLVKRILMNAGEAEPPWYLVKREPERLRNRSRQRPAWAALRERWFRIGFARVQSRKRRSEIGFFRRLLAPDDLASQRFKLRDASAARCAIGEMRRDREFGSFGRATDGVCGEKPEGGMSEVHGHQAVPPALSVNGVYARMAQSDHRRRVLMHADFLRARPGLISNPRESFELEVILARRLRAGSGRRLGRIMVSLMLRDIVDTSLAAPAAADGFRRRVAALAEAQGVPLADADQAAMAEMGARYVRETVRLIESCATAAGQARADKMMKPLTGAAEEWFLRPLPRQPSGGLFGMIAAAYLARSTLRAVSEETRLRRGFPLIAADPHPEAPAIRAILGAGLARSLDTLVDERIAATGLRDFANRAWGLQNSLHATGRISEWGPTWADEMARRSAEIGFRLA